MITTGPIVTAFIAIAAFGAVLVAFSNNASPYVTIAQACKMGGNDTHLHLAGDIVKDTVHLDVLRHALTFDIKDADGNRVTVEHVGEPPANIAEANKVVAIGCMKGDRFVSQQLLVKCPSKYEAGKPGTVGAKT
jgi:cytochrome c-type biogenesis protein CcmE